MLTLKAPVTTAADDIHKYFSIVFSEKIRLDVSSESSARQRIHMKNQALFSSKGKSKKLKCHLLQYLFGPLRVKHPSNQYFSHVEILPPGPGCSKLTMLLVNVSLNFQKLISQICQYFL